MDVARRFVFRGNAVVLGGRIHRPTDRIIAADGASSLPVVGGQSRGRLSTLRFAPYVTLAGGSSQADGLFTDGRRARAVTRGKGREDQLSSRSVVTVVARGVQVGSAGRVKVRRLTATLQSAVGPDTRQPSFVVAKETAIEGVTIDGYPLTVTIDRAAISGYDTFDKLVSAVRSQAGVAQGGASLRIVDPVTTDRPEVILVSIVRELAWTRKTHPDATLEGHMVRVPDFGRIVFGEMLITELSRRLTMARMCLGSPEGGDLAFSEVETNGSWFPPLPVG
jgi:hypothetical protein